MSLLNEIIAPCDTLHTSVSPRYIRTKDGLQHTGFTSKDPDVTIGRLREAALWFGGTAVTALDIHKALLIYDFQIEYDHDDLNDCGVYATWLKKPFAGLLWNYEWNR